MPATQYDITIERRASFSLPLLLTDAAGAPSDLSGVTLVGQVRRDFDRALQASFVYSVISSGDASVDLTLATGVTAVMDLAPCSYDVFMDSATGSVKLLYGTASIVTNQTA